MKEKEVQCLNRFEIKFESRSENEGFARVVAAAFAAQSDPTLEELTEIKTAVSEAVSNAIIHGYEGENKGSVLMEMSLFADGKLLIVIIDEGIGIENVEQAKEPLFTTKIEEERSGMGFTVMESFMDRLVVTSTPGEGTRVSMWKQLDRNYGF